MQTEPIWFRFRYESSVFMNVLVRLVICAFIIPALPLEVHASPSPILQSKQVLKKCLEAADRKGLNWNYLVEGEGRYVLKQNFDITKGRSWACSKNPPYVFPNTD